MSGPAVRSARTALGVALVVFLIAGCAPGVNELANTVSSTGRVAGFWQGLWNGMIVIITFVISLFSKNVQIYEVHNSGAWYNFGFLFGACMSLGGGTHGAARRPRKAELKKARVEIVVDQSTGN